MKMLELVVRKKKMKNTYKILVSNLKEPRRRFGDHFQMDLKER
jgi:hypothetical protein